MFGKTFSIVITSLWLTLFTLMIIGVARKAFSHEVHIGAAIKHFDSCEDCNEGLIKSLSYSYNGFGGTVFEDSYYETSYALHYQYMWKFIGVKAGVVNKGKDFEGGRHTFPFVMPVVRLGKKVFVDLTVLPWEGGWYGAEFGFKF